MFELYRVPLYGIYMGRTMWAYAASRDAAWFTAALIFALHEGLVSPGGTLR